MCKYANEEMLAYANFHICTSAHQNRILTVNTYICTVKLNQMGLIRFLISAICILYIIRSLARWFLPMIFQSVINKATQQQGYQQQNYQQQQKQQRKPEGAIKIDHIPQNKSSVPDSEGDFVDYEEIK
jgi:hypothetical protein